MTSTKAASRFGLSREVDVAQLLEDEGWLCASRRHVGGAGDVLAIRLGHRPLLIEVKSTARSPWRNFSKQARRDILHTAATYNAKALLCWWPKAWSEPQWLGVEDWPPS